MRELAGPLTHAILKSQLLLSERYFRCSFAHPEETSQVRNLCEHGSGSRELWLWARACRSVTGPETLKTSTAGQVYIEGLF